MKSDAYTGIVTVLKDNPQLAESSEMQAQIKQVNAVVKKAVFGVVLAWNHSKYL